MIKKLLGVHPGWNLATDLINPKPSFSSLDNILLLIILAILTIIVLLQVRISDIITTS